MNKVSKYLIICLLVTLNTSLFIFKDNITSLYLNDLESYKVKQNKVFIKDMLKSDSLESKIALHKCNEIESLIEDIEYCDAYQLVAIINDKKILNNWSNDTYTGKIIFFVNPNSIDTFLINNDNTTVKYKSIFNNLNVNVFFLILKKEVYFPFVSTTHKDISMNYLAFINKWNQSNNR
ncbi:hypothetical protein LX69_02676 [Breznakibacter xylanolyticus]|uniref:Uncharacterized protein n=1 Tax=Breznakibacter xylanolyticus TaxID=990 RepID=A0A2W7N020_9BACT|nr:hypothetical protein [Breznakibacter xylanolyticus]PZX13420.1 hypothetical protein LX69_02676 [Breznakibacter xylanolyticus]